MAPGKGSATVDIAIRRVTLADSGHVASLVSALGYPTSSAQMVRRLESILSDDDYATLVACEGERIVGFVGTRVGLLFEGDGLYGQIMAVAVAPDCQRNGIGRMLMHAAESMLIARGACVFVVTSGNHRADAHAFYENIGYTFTGRRYGKRVRSSA